MEVEVREGRQYIEYYEIHAGRHSFVNEGGVAKHDEGGRVEHAIKYFTEYRVYRGDKLLRTLHGAGGFNKNFVTLWFALMFGRVVRGATSIRPVFTVLDYWGVGRVGVSLYGLDIGTKDVEFYPMVPLNEYNEDYGEFRAVESNVYASSLFSFVFGSGDGGPYPTACSNNVLAGRTGIVLGGPYCVSVDGAYCQISGFSVNRVKLLAYQLCPLDPEYGGLDVTRDTRAIDYRKLVFGGFDIGETVGTLYFRRRAEHTIGFGNVICESGLHGEIRRDGNMPPGNKTDRYVVMFANDVISTSVDGCIQLAQGEAVEVIAYLRVVGT